MTWFRVDDKSAFHAKIVDAGNAAWGALVRMGAWSKDHKTDGDVPERIVRLIATETELADLLRVGLLRKVREAYQIHDFLSWNESDKAAKKLIENRRNAGRIGGLKRVANRQASAQANATDLLEDRSSKGVGVGGGSGSDPDPEGVQGEDVAKTGVLPSHARYADAYALGIQDAGYTFSGISAPWEYGALGRACAHAEGRRGAELDAWFRAAACAYRRLMADKSGQAGYQPTAFLRWLDDSQWRQPRAKAPRRPVEAVPSPEPTPEAQPFVDASTAVLDVARLFEPKAVGK